jgi:hypothetical protein
MQRGDVEKHRVYVAEALRQTTANSQEIAGRLGEVKNKRRRREAGRSLLRFCKAYFPGRFSLKFSDDHLRVIAKLQNAVIHGDQFALAMPRGSGKTTLAQVAVLFAILYGHRPFVSLIGSTMRQSGKMLAILKKELRLNALLREDFPLEVGPFWALGKSARKCEGQRYNGTTTDIEWLADRIVFATIPGSMASGSIVSVCGITGEIRGQVDMRADGTLIRPSLVILDDPQTDKSAGSLTMTEERENIIADAVLGLAGPGVKITAVMLCTVISRGDLSDRTLSHTDHPEWSGERTKMLYEFPTNMALWQEYARIWTDERSQGGDGSAATHFYRDNRTEMDAGAKVAWLQRIEKGCVSALESAMKLYLFSRRRFMSEYQNDPEEDALTASGRLDPRAVAERWNGRPIGEVPLRTEWITAHVDIHDDLLYYQVTAFEPGYTGSVIEYGTWPKQNDGYFALSNVHTPLSAKYPNRGKEGTIYAGLEELLQTLLTRSYRRDDGQTMQIALALVDAGYVPDVVGKVVRALNRGPQLMAAKGFGIGASRKPYSEYKREPGVRTGQHWRIAPAPGTRLPTVAVDTNWWKSFYRDRLRTPVGDPGAIQVFGERADQHRLWADHCGGEYPVSVVGPWGQVEEWKTEPNRDIHWWDNGIGCCVAAAILGVKMEAWAETGRRQRRTVSLSAMVGGRK